MKKTLQHRVLETLRDNPGLSPKDLASILEVDINKIKVILYKLKTAGYIEKAGKGFLLTQRGMKFLEYLEKGVSEAGEKKTSEIRETQPPTPQEEQAIQLTEIQSVTSTVNRETSIEYRELINEILNRISLLEKKVASLENQVRNIELALQSRREKRENGLTIDPPVQPYNEAYTKYGSIIDRLINENKLVRIGSLVVDSTFYHEFKSRFPLKVSDIDKLTTYEKLLLEEMRREALVILHAGKEYRLVS